LHLDCGTPEPYHADADSQTYTIDERLFSQVENLWAALCLHFAYYNFCRIHKSLRVRPAMQAGITDRVWDIAELLTQ
jgi:hypothetical protein